ncbi:hypothetical protein KC221_29365, partial [Mycobacterium tuberculosis]|nr:hypothetical protein [Mycobacterium tuberculosis]
AASAAPREPRAPHSGESTSDRQTRIPDLGDRYLPDDALERFRERAAVYDRENTFFDEDLEELRALGYLTLFVPESHGGP